VDRICIIYRARTGGDTVHGVYVYDSTEGVSAKKIMCKAMAGKETP